MPIVAGGSVGFPCVSAAAAVGIYLLTAAQAGMDNISLRVRHGRLALLRARQPVPFSTHRRSRARWLVGASRDEPAWPSGLSGTDVGYSVRASRPTRAHPMGFDEPLQRPVPWLPWRSRQLQQALRFLVSLFHLRKDLDLSGLVSFGHDLNSTTFCSERGSI